MKKELENLFHYRCYDELAILYHKKSNIYVIFEDIFAVMFSIMMNEGESKEVIIHKIMEEYEVDYNTVSEDVEEFYNEINLILEAKTVSHQANADVDNYEETENYVFDLVSQRMIPFTATIEITDNCNLKCAHCYREQEVKNLWTIELFEKTLKELKAMGTLHIVFAGSEPFMHPDIVRMIELVSEYGFVLTVQTNATLLNEKILRALRLCTVKSIFVSLYSDKASIHDSITGKVGSLDKTLAAIKTLKENGFYVRASVSIFEANKTEVLSIHNLCKELDIDAGYNFKIIPAIDRNKDTVVLNCFDKEEMIGYITDPELKLFHREIKNSSKKENTIPVHYCYTGFRSITITYDLNVVICNAYRKLCGNITESSIEEIWECSNVLNHWRTVGSLVNDKCKSCDAYQYCEPCPAHQYTKDGADDTIDELTCTYGKMFKEACDNAKALIK